MVLTHQLPAIRRGQETLEVPHTRPGLALGHELLGLHLQQLQQLQHRRYTGRGQCIADTRRPSKG